MIKKIILELNKKEITLTLDEAKELQRQLNNAFEVKEVVRYARPWYEQVYGGNPYKDLVRYPAITCDNTADRSWLNGDMKATTDTLFLKVN